MSVRYIAKTFHKTDGWLLTVPDGIDPAAAATDPSLRVSLPWYLKVDLLETKGGRDYFRVLEGTRKDFRASVTQELNGQSHLTDQIVQRPPALVRLSRKRQQVWYGSKGPFNAFSELTNPVPQGTYDLEIPDYPHPDYYPESGNFQFVWFRVGHHGDRYLHLGTISHGCATVRPWIPDKKRDGRFFRRSDSELGLPVPEQSAPFADWNEVCAYLLPARKGDSLSVGAIQVVD